MQPHSRFLIRCKDGSLAFADLKGEADIVALWSETERVAPGQVAFFQRIPLPKQEEVPKEYVN